MFFTGELRRPVGIAAVILALFLTFEPAKAKTPVAAALGPEVAVGNPSGGYVGRLTLTPDHGPIGTPVKVIAEGLPPNQEFQIVWRTVKGRWKVKGAGYHGREYKPVAYQVAIVTSDSTGGLSATFTAPEDFGFSHDVVIQQKNRLFTKGAFNIDMTMAISPKSGPVGTPITVDVKGIGWRYLQNSWMLLYDNNFTGWMSSVTTGGSAKFTIPATGGPGIHVLEAMHGAFTFPYRNTQQNPMPGQPLFALKFKITPGDPVLPPPPEKQVQTSVRGLPSAGVLETSPRFSGIKKPVLVRAKGFKAGKTYQLNWTSVTGNRIVGSGWNEDSQVVAKAKADASGNVRFSFKAPDDLGGAHRLWVQDGVKKKEGTYWITPTALPLNADRGPAGTPFTMHLKGVGWTETANIYTIVYDNSYTGYACGFNSQGDIEIFMKATGNPGWHFIDLYPAIYKGKERKPRNFQIPQLTYEQDHPGEDLPRFRFAFKITETADTTASR
jgi:hypothetical protein